MESCTEMQGRETICYTLKPSKAYRNLGILVKPQIAENVQEKPVTNSENCRS